MTTDFDIHQFVQDRNNALLSLSEPKILAYLDKYDDGEITAATRAYWQTEQGSEVFWAGVHKARLEVRNDARFTPEVCRISREWLKAHGFRTDIQ